MILVVEDRKDSKSFISSGLKDAGYDISITGQTDKAPGIIKDQEIRIVIIDKKTDGNSGIKLCSRIRQSRFKKYVYIIIVNTGGGDNDVNGALDAGADDYLPLSGNPAELILRIKVAMRMLEMEDRVSESRRELIRVAKEDSLTGLLNRRAFLDEAINEMERATREHHILSSLMIEIDNYKDIIDKVGFEARDAMLVEIAVRLQSSCRSYDKIARYGGGVYVVLLPNTRTKTAVKVAKRIQSELSGRTFYLMGESVSITACIGVSLMAPDLGLKDAQLDDLMRRTELSLKAAKKEGANKIAVSGEK
ncbi:MAG: diguanylate cyclase [Spirochaetes bacterium]|jgi:diguanylate cyclase (GGDEF)-like protein|nr:diguanylate cyclase [Spirochaetota bacterium]